VIKYSWLGLLLAIFCTSLHALEIVETVRMDPQDVNTGVVNQDIQALARRAIDENLQLTLTAPEFWKDKVIAQLEEGSGDDTLNFKYRKTVIENVIIRLISTEVAAKPAAPAPVAVTPRVQTDNTETTELADAAVEAMISESTSRAEDDARQVAREAAEKAASEMSMSQEKLDMVVAPVTAVPLSKPEPVMQEPVAEKDNASVVQTTAAEVAVSVPQEATTDTTPPVTPESVIAQAAPAEEPAIVAETDNASRVVLDTDQDHVTTPATLGVADQAAARTSLERRLNNGRSIDRDIAVDEIRQGDVLFVTDGVMALVRRGGARQRVYWVNGSVDLESDALNREQAGKYSVLSTLNIAGEDAEGATVTEVIADEPEEVIVEVEVAVPANQTERARMEALYNDGKIIDEGLSIAGLLPDDTLYVGNGEIMVFRQGRLRARKFWLEEPIDLELEELYNIGTRKYLVKRLIR